MSEVPLAAGICRARCKRWRECRRGSPDSPILRTVCHTLTHSHTHTRTLSLSLSLSLSTDGGDGSVQTDRLTAPAGAHPSETDRFDRWSNSLVKVSRGRSYHGRCERWSGCRRGSPDRPILRTVCHTLTHSHTHTRTLSLSLSRQTVVMGLSRLTDRPVLRARTPLKLRENLLITRPA